MVYFIAVCVLSIIDQSSYFYAGASPYTIALSDGELILPGTNEIAVRVDPSLDPICPRRPRQRVNFELPDVPT